MTIAFVEVFTDGASRGNPGRGGWGALLRFRDTKGKVHEREMSQGYTKTTNNRMEIMGVISALEALKRKCHVHVYSDSKYLVNAFNEKWVYGWEKKNWKNANKETVKNVDLWQRLLNVVRKHEVEFSWVHGHAGHPENERCDTLATQAADATSSHIADVGYEKEFGSGTIHSMFEGI